MMRIRNQWSFLLLLGLPLYSHSQSDSVNVVNWQFRAMYGMNIALNSTEVGSVADELIEYSDNSDYIHLGLTLYLGDSKTWGLDGVVQLQSHEMNIDGYSDFRSSVRERYEPEYYVLRNTVNEQDGIESGNSKMRFGNVNKFYVGASYHHRQSKFHFTPRFMVGLVQVESRNAEISLKKRNSNQIKEVTYFSSEPNKPHFAVLMGPTVGYELVKDLMIYAEFYYSYMHANFKYTIEERDVYTEQTTETETDHPNGVHTFNAGVGLVLNLAY